MKRFEVPAAIFLAAALFCFASCGGETKGPKPSDMTGVPEYTETMKTTDSAESTDERVTEPTMDTPVLTTGIDRDTTSEATTTGDDHVQAITEDTWRDFTYAFTYQEQEYSLSLSLPEIYDRLDDRTFFISDYDQPLMENLPQYIYIDDPIIIDDLITHHPYGKEVSDVSQFLVTEVYRIMDMHPGWFNLNYANFDFHGNCGWITSWRAPNTENQPGFNSIYRYIALLCMDTDIYMQIHFSGDFEDARDIYFMDNVGNNILQHIEISTPEKAAETTAESEPAEESRTDHLKEQFLDNIKKMTWQDFTYELIFQEENCTLRLSLPSCYNRIDEQTFAADDTLVPSPYTPKYLYIGEPILLDQLAAYDREGKKISTGSQFHAAATDLILDAYPDLAIASQTHINVLAGNEFIVTWADDSGKDWPYRYTAFVNLGDDTYLQLHFSEGILDADGCAGVDWIKKNIFLPYGIAILTH